MRSIEPGMTETRSSPRQCLFNEARGLKRSRIVAKSGDDLHTDWQSTLGDISGNVDARDAHQGPEPVETGIAGPVEPLWSCARRGERQQHIDVVEQASQCSPRPAHYPARLVILGGQEADGFIELCPQQRWHRVVVRPVLPGERLMRLEFHHRRMYSPGLRKNLRQRDRANGGAGALRSTASDSLRLHCRRL